MTPVYQTIVDSNNGNCMQAAFASLFDLPLDDVPNFKEVTDWFQVLWQFLKRHGYEYNGLLVNPKSLGCWGEDRFLEIKEMNGINGFFFATVNSPKFFDSVKYCDYKDHSPTHAVVIDKDFNIVHDPNLAYKDIKNYPLHEYIGYNGIINIYLIEKIEEK